MTAALSSQLKLTGDQLRVMAARVGSGDLPTVLAARPHHRTIDRREAAFGRAARELLACNLIDGDTVHPDLVPVLQALQRPDRELAMRLVSPEGTVRISAVRRGTLCVLAQRVDDDVLVRIIGHQNEFRDVVPLVAAELPQARPAVIQSIGAPLRQMSDSLSGTRDALEMADRIRALGADSHSALLLGSALAARQAFVEIVYSVLADSQDMICRIPAAVGVFYTKRGRIVGVPSVSPSGELWTTLKPGSDQAIAHAIGGLLEFADESLGS